MIVNALGGKPLPVYGDGKQIRDWLYVKDHCAAIVRTLQAGIPGETYNIGGWNEKPNIEIVNIVCGLLDELRPQTFGSYRSLITFVTDRPGHDRRYAIDASKIERELGWKPAETFETGIRKTRSVVPGKFRLGGKCSVRGLPDLDREALSRKAWMKILLFGKSGQVGWELQRSLAPLGEVVALEFL